MGAVVGTEDRGQGAGVGLRAFLAMVIAVTAVLLAGEAGVTVGLSPGKAIGAGDVGLLVLVTVPPLTFEIVGAIILLRQSRNAIAWLMCAVGLSYSLGVFTTDLATYEYKIEHVRDAMLLVPGVISNVVFGPFLLSIAALLILFPTGRSPGLWWGRVFWADAGVGSFMLLVALFSSATLGSTPVRNPVALPFVPEFTEGIAFGTIASLLPLSLAGLVRRFWLSRGEERQQLKWFTYGATVLIISFAIAFNENFSSVLILPYFLALTFMPIATGIAISKYRLWDIDVLINRTLMYGSLTLSLGGIYVLGVLGIQAALRLVTGQSSTIAVAVTTLAVVALFGPLRRRIQAGIDRRFYRRRYDAEQTLTALNMRLRDEVDLTLVTSEVLAVVRDTMQPAHVSLWLRHAERPGSRPPHSI